MSAHEFFDIRRQNLTQLIDQWIESQQFKTGKEICDYYGLDAVYIAQLLNSKRQIGKQAARDLELKFRLPLEYLDQVQPEILLAKRKNANLDLYSMQAVQQQLFQRVYNGQASLKLMDMSLADQFYLLKISTTEYEPFLKSSWCLLLQQQQQPKMMDWVCVNLKNQCSLLMQYHQQHMEQWCFYALDGLKQVQFHQEDIVSVDVIAVICAPHQVRIEIQD